MGKVFITKEGKVAFVSPGCVANFTFYARDPKKPKSKGSRIATRPALWFATQEEAETALADYAKKRGWHEQT